MPHPEKSPLNRAAVLRGAGFAAAVVLGAVAVWLIVTGTTQKRIEIGVLTGLWGLLLGSYSVFGSRRPILVNADQAGLRGRTGTGTDRPAEDPASGSGLAVRAGGDLERSDDAATRRAWEASLEEMLRREIRDAMQHEVSDLRAEIGQLRKELVDKVGGQMRLERIETTRLIGSDLEALQHEVRQLKVASETGPLPELTVERAGGQTRVTSTRTTVRDGLGPERAVPPRAAPARPAEREPVAERSGSVPPTPEPVDAEPIDAAPIDAAPIDAEPIDAGPVDAEIVAGPIDAGPIDAGPVDAEIVDDSTEAPPTVQPEAVLPEPVATPTDETAPFRAIRIGRTPPLNPEPAKPQASNPEPAKPEPAKPEPAKPEPAKPEPAKPELEPAKFQRQAGVKPDKRAERPSTGSGFFRDDPFASLPRISPFTDFEVDAPDQAAETAAPTRSTETAAPDAEQARHSRHGSRITEPAASTKHAADEPRVGRRHRRAEENEGGEDLLAKLLARERVQR